MAKTLEEHYGYLSDRVKLAQYQAAIDRLVRPEHIVLDLGCGSGLLGLMALRAGASKVLFVEEASIIEIAHRTVTKAGFADKAEFFQKNSFELALPGLVDIVVCDHVGYFGFDYGILAMLADAKQRFLTPGGIIVPAHIELKAAPVESPACRTLVSQWRDGSVPTDFEWVGATSANTKHAVSLKPQELLADAVTLATLDLGPETAQFLTWTTEHSCSRDGVLDGIAGWFDCQLADGVHMTNSPTSAEHLDRPQAFLPLESPVTVKAGETIRATVMVRHLDRVIGWVVELPKSGQKFAQNTFNGLLLDREALTHAHPDRVAKLNDHGQARQIVLSYCDGQRALSEVRSLVQQCYPDLFPSPQALDAFVARVLASDTSE